MFNGRFIYSDINEATIKHNRLLIFGIVAVIIIIIIFLESFCLNLFTILIHVTLYTHSNHACDTRIRVTYYVFEMLDCDQSQRVM